MTDRPRGGTPPSGIPGGDTPGITPPSGIPGGDTPPSRIPGGDTPPSGTPGGDTPPSRIPGGDTPPSGTPGGDTPPSGTPGGDTPPSGTRGGDTPPSGIPGGDTPPSRIPGGDTPPFGILESVLYARDLVATETFYRDVLGLLPYARLTGRHLFYRCGQQMLLIFNPEATRLAPACGGLPVPAHGAEGVGHLCFAASAGEIAAWRARLTARGVSIEADFAWPGGGRSLYFRDPAGNSLEFAEPRIWNLP